MFKTTHPLHRQTKRSPPKKRYTISMDLQNVYYPIFFRFSPNELTTRNAQNHCQTQRESSPPHTHYTHTNITPMTSKLTRRTILSPFIPKALRTTAKIVPYSPRTTKSKSGSADTPSYPYYLIKFEDLVELMKSEPRLPSLEEAKKRGVLRKYEDIAVKASSVSPFSPNQVPARAWGRWVEVVRRYWISSTDRLENHSESRKMLSLVRLDVHATTRSRTRSKQWSCKDRSCKS